MKRVVWPRLAQALCVVCLAARVASAQPSPEPVTWQYGGFVDGAFMETPNDPDNHVFRSRATTWHLDNWYVNMAAIYAKKKATAQSRWGVEIEAQDGKDDEIFGFSGTAPNLKGADVLRHLGLANVSYLAPVGKGLTVQGGIFGSLIGYDGLYAKDNFNYTRPWGAEYTPYLLLGVNASYPVSDRLTVTGFVVNGYAHLADASDRPSVGGQVGYALTPRDTLKETIFWGPQQSNAAVKYWRVLTDTILEHKTDPVTVAFEYTMSSEQVNTGGDPTALWISSQLPVRWHLQGPWTVALRPEVAWDRDGRWTLARQTIKAFTATLEYKLPYKWSTTILRGEYRVDDSRGPQGGFFTQHGLLTPTQQLFIVAAIVSFDSPASSH
jgi:hypothetical protein